LLVGLITIIIDPIKQQIIYSFDQVREQFFKRGCRIYFYGNGRTGKTTLIGGLISIRIPQKGVKTKKRRIYKAKVLLDFQSNKYVPLQLQDYKGQAPKDAFFPDQRFAGSIGKSRIHVILFVVDIFDELMKKDKTIMSDDELYKYYSTKTEVKIGARVAENKEYINSVTISVILSRLLNRERLIGVILVINKIDLLQELINNGKIKTSKTTEEYAKNLYEDTANHIQKFCNENDLAEGLFNIWCVSAQHGFKTRQMFAKLFDKYLGINN